MRVDTFFRGQFLFVLYISCSSFRQWIYERRASWSRWLIWSLFLHSTSGKKNRHLILGYGHGLTSPWLLVIHPNTWSTNSERPMLSNHCHSTPHNNHSDMLVEGSSGFEKGSQLWVLQTALRRAPHNFFNFIKAIFHQQIQGGKLQLISTEMSQDFARNGSSTPTHSMI